MLKSELITRIADELTQLPVHEIVHHSNKIVAVLCETLAKGGRIEIRGFGSFSLHYRPPHKARNPKTGKQLMTQAKHRPHFKPGKELRERVKNSINS